jgi:trans-aconitate 2-methyltransferase
VSQTWNPDQYEKFRAERAQPFWDLVAMIHPREKMRVIDLGCGTGELSAELADKLGAEVEAIDSSSEMLAKAKPHPRRTTRVADLHTIENFAGYDLVISNAVFHWVADNERVLSRILDTLRPGAQIAVQLPVNIEHPSHRIAGEVAQSASFSSLLGGFVSRSGALTLDRYAELLFAHGFRNQVCIEKIYGHVLPSTADVVEWTKGTTLTPYLSRLANADQKRFLDEYRTRVVAALGERAPYFYPFRRLLFWGEKS